MEDTGIVRQIALRPRRQGAAFADVVHIEGDAADRGLPAPATACSRKPTVIAGIEEDVAAGSAQGTKIPARMLLLQAFQGSRGQQVAGLESNSIGMRPPLLRTNAAGDGRGGR